MERVPMRDGYGKALLELCRLHDDVLVLDADVAKSTRTEWIRQEYPENISMSAYRNKTWSVRQPACR